MAATNPLPWRPNSTLDRLEVQCAQHVVRGAFVADLEEAKVQA